MNHFYRMWHDAERNKNEYCPTEVHWSEVPGRDAVWKEQTIANTSEAQFKVEFECEVLGSVNTLLNPAGLKTKSLPSLVLSSLRIDCHKGASSEIEGKSLIGLA